MVTRHFEDDLIAAGGFDGVNRHMEKRANLSTELRAINDFKAKHLEKLEAAKKAIESTEADYRQSLADYSLGKTTEAETAKTLTLRDDARKARAIAQDAVATLEAQSTVLLNKLAEVNTGLAPVYKRSSSTWLEEVWPDMERAALEVMEDCAVAQMIANETADGARFVVERLVGRVMENASKRFKVAKRRLEGLPPKIVSE